MPAGPGYLTFATTTKGERWDVPVATIYSGLDGGMNNVFHARFPDKIVPLAKVLPAALQLPQLPPMAWVDNDGSVASKMFGTLF